MGSMGVMDLGEAGILVQLSGVEGSSKSPMAHPRIAMGEAVGSCQCQKKVVEGSSRKMALEAKKVGEGNNRSLEKAREEKEKGGGGGGGGGEKIGWHGLSQAAHIVQDIWSFDMAFMVDMASHSPPCTLKPTTRASMMRLNLNRCVAAIAK